MNLKLKDAQFYRDPLEILIGCNQYIENVTFCLELFLKNITVLSGLDGAKQFGFTEIQQALLMF